MSQSLRQRCANSLGVTYRAHSCYGVPVVRSAPDWVGIENESVRIPGGIGTDPYWVAISVSSYGILSAFESSDIERSIC
jgi:hypothetical protein